MKIMSVFWLALAAFFIARGIGIPVWRSWEPGDATDIAPCIFLGLLLWRTA